MANNYDTTTKFKVDISELKSAMQEAKRQIQVANSEFKAISSSMEDWSKSTDGISAKLKQLDSNLKSQESILSSLERQYELTVAEMGEGSKEADNLKIAINNQKAVINNTKKEIDKYEKSLAEVDEAQGDTGDSADDLGQDLDELTDKAKESGDGFTVMKGALSSLVADGIRAAISALKDLASSVVEVGTGFSSSMAEVQAISGASADELEQLEATARQFGATTVFSASESADALKYMALAGWSVEQSTSALGGVLNLAAASGMGLAEASDMVTDYLSAFSMEAQDSAYFADMLAFAQSNSNTSAAQLGEAFKNCAANLNAAGQDVETTTALLAAMANQGLKGSEAGTALTAVMRDMTSKMSNYKDEAELAGLAQDGFKSVTGDLNDLLGVNAIAIGKTLVPVSDLNGNYRDLTDILKDVEAATNGMGDAEKASALLSTFTADSIKGLNLILNDGVDNSAAFEEALRKSSGTAENMADIMNDNLAGDVKAFQSALEELSLKVYDVLEPVLRDVIAFVQELANEFNEWLADPENQKALEELGNNLKDFVQGALTTLMDGIKWFIANKDTVIAGLVAIAAALVAMNVVTMIQGLVKAFKAWQVATEGMTIAQKLLNLVMAANPIGIIITAIAALVAGFIYLWNTSDEFREFWINLWDNIKEITGKVIDAIVVFFTGLWEDIKAIWSTVSEWFNTNVIEPLTEFFSGLWTTVSTFFVNLWTDIKAIWSTVSDWFNTKVIIPVVSFFTELWAKIVEIFTELWDKIVEIFSPVVEWFSKLFNSIWDTLKSIIDVIVVLLKGCWEIIKAVFGVVSEWFNTKVIQPVANFFKAMWEKISDGAKTAWDFVVNVFKTVSNWFNTNVIQPVSKFFTELWAKVSKLASDSWEAIKVIFKTVSNWFNVNVIQPVGKFFTGMWDGLKSGAAKAWDGIKEVFSKVSDFFKDTFTKAWTKVKDVFSTGGKIFDGIKEGIVDAFKTIVNGIIKGINKVISTPFNTINKALEFIRDIELLGISPFKSLGTISIPEIPLLRKGGILRKGQMGLLEGDGAEAVVPLEKNTEWINNLAKGLADNLRGSAVGLSGSGITGGVVNNFYQTNNSPKALSRLEIYRQSKNLLSYAGGM